MSRPGPRPYECARRAWHSDRHQPMRGSIIQQIFRVVTESHCPATKKNIEWQEKLPIVVLKAEEIMYSKANSEAEYMDLGTLWDRVNDAIDTIIKRDESTETGDLLPPCVEVRASRSQRLANPRTYLPPRTQAHGFVSPKVLHNTTNEQNPQLPHLHNSNQVTSARPVAVNSTHVPESNRHVRETNSSNIPAISCNIPSSSHNQVVPVESNTSQNESSVCPLDYGIHFQSAIPQLGFEVSRNPNPILLGKPIFPSSINTAQMGSLQNLFSCERDESASTRVSREDSRDNHGKSPEKGFDLSLRLGWFEDTCTKPEKVLDHDANAVDLSSYQMGSMFNDLSPHPHKEFSFFPVETASDPLGFRKRESEVRNEEAAVRKRKAPINDNLEDGLFFSQSELRPNHFFGRMKRPGS